MSTLLLSYPGADFRPEGAGESAAAPHRALSEWLALCDHILRAGGRILVLDPPAATGAPSAASPTPTVYAGRLGAVFNSPGKLARPTFLRAHAAGAPAATATAGPSDGATAGPIDGTTAGATDDPACRLLSEAGLDVRIATAPWQGQVDLIPLERNRFLICHGGASPSSRQATDELRTLLPMGAQVVEVELAPGIPRGVQAVQYIAGAGSAALLCHRAALRSHTPEQLGRFAGSHVEVLGLNEEDVAAHAAECLVVRGHALLAPGSSTILRGQLARRGFQIVEVEISHLIGPAGGGPRQLALDLPGLVLAEDSPSYANRRAALLQRLEHYAAD